jgi:hypothetical protein
LFFVNYTYNIAPIEGLEVLVNTTAPTVFRVAVQTSQYAEALLRVRLGTPPRPAVHPFLFATERSRRYYFYLVRAGRVRTNGRRYVRSGRLVSSWRVLPRGGSRRVRLAIFNQARVSQFVFGNAAGSRQVPGHRITGWPLAAKQLPAILREANAYFERRYDEEVGLQFVTLRRRVRLKEFR